MEAAVGSSSRATSLVHLLATWAGTGEHTGTHLSGESGREVYSGEKQLLRAQILSRRKALLLFFSGVKVTDYE